MQPLPRVSHIAVVNNADNTPLWVIEVSDTTMNVKVTDAFVALADRHELWMVPANGEAPISLGLMPEVNGDTRATPDILLTKHRGVSSELKTWRLSNRRTYGSAIDSANVSGICTNQPPKGHLTWPFTFYKN